MLNYLSIQFIRIYQQTAPAYIRRGCRFEPTCSEYALMAIDKYGAIKGWALTVKRLKRCRPPNGGIDLP